MFLFGVDLFSPCSYMESPYNEKKNIDQEVVLVGEGSVVNEATPFSLQTHLLMAH